MFWEVENTVLPEVLAGRPYEEGETNAIVIPKYLSTKVMADTDGAIPEEEIIDGEQFLGQVKEFEYYGINPQTEKYEVLETLPLKVVGVYDNYKYFTLANECYAAPGTVTDLLIQQHKEAEEATQISRDIGRKASGSLRIRIVLKTIWLSERPGRGRLGCRLGRSV